MAIVRYDPFSNLSSLLRWPALIDEDFSGSSQSLDLYETKDSVVIKANVAGIDPKNVEVTFHKGVLSIKAEATEEHKEDRRYYQRSYSNYFYKVAVPGEIDQNGEPEARFENGMIKVTFKKVPEEQPKKISVKS